MASFLGGLVDDARAGASRFARRVDARLTAEALRRVDSFREDLKVRRDSIVNFLTNLGKSGRDKGTANVPGRPVYMTYEARNDAYEGNPYARKACEDLPSDALRHWLRITDLTADDPDTAVAIDKIDEDLDTPAVFLEAAIEARKHGGALILPILTEDVPAEYADDPAAWLAEPLDPDLVISVDAVHVLDASEFSPVAPGTDPRSEFYRETELWNVAPDGDLTLSGRRIHASRVIYVPGIKVSPRRRRWNNGIDRSVIEYAWVSIARLTAADAAAGTMMQDFNLDILKIAGFGDLDASDAVDVVEAKAETMAIMAGLANMPAIGEGDDIVRAARNVNGWRDLYEHARASYLAAIDEPETRAFGTNAAGLSNEDGAGRDNWQSRGEAFQRFVTPGVVKFYRLALSARESALEGEVPERWRVQWNPVQVRTDLEEANLRKVHAETDAIRISSQIVPADHVARSRYTEGGYRNDLLPLSEEDLEDDGSGDAEAAAALALLARTAPPGEEDLESVQDAAGVFRLLGASPSAAKALEALLDAGHLEPGKVADLFRPTEDV